METRFLNILPQILNINCQAVINMVQKQKQQAQAVVKGGSAYWINEADSICVALENLRQTCRGNNVFDQLRHCATVHLIVKGILVVNTVGRIQGPGLPRTFGQLRVIRQRANVTLICLTL